MKTVFVHPVAFVFLVFLIFPGAAFAAELPVLTRGGEFVVGGPSGGAKAVVDTFALVGPAGSGAPYLGDFESGWNGWTSEDVTQPLTNHWQVSDYNQATVGNLAAWCGESGLPACGGADVAGGYGNDWHDLLVFRTAVADPAASATVTVAATLQNDTEPGYDYTYLSTQVEGVLGHVNLRSWDGLGTFAVSESMTYQPEDLVQGTDILVSFRFVSDYVYSDEDCLHPSAGACRIDDITVTISQSGQADIVSFTDFQDGTFGGWFPDSPQGVGDFAQRWRGLEDIDPCRTNYSWQVAFVDDGLVVPGTGGSVCLNWCYGPGGYIVNTTGGLAGPDAHLDNRILSPVMAWPAGDYDGMVYAYDAYEHEDLSVDSPGIFISWAVRSADTDGSAGHGIQHLADQPWRNRLFTYYPSGYTRYEHQVGDLLERGRDQVQVSLRVQELGWAWGWTGNDGYPAPYFDNVAVKVHPYGGPALSARELDLAQDNFPEIDVLVPGDPGSMHVRFDAARNIAPAAHLRNDPGDSVVVTVASVRSGASLAGPPVLHYVIDANPAFDAYRTVPAAGGVDGRPAVGSTGLPIADRWAFDLPDTGTLFPGDVLHYYVRAGDVAGGDFRYATLPADLAGFGDFSDPLAYDQRFTVRALPTMTALGGGFVHRPVLLWDDAGAHGDLETWVRALEGIYGPDSGRFDIYRTQAASTASAGNGIGGRTDGGSLDGYRLLLYTSGRLGSATLGNGDSAYNPADDIGALTNWLDGWSRGLLMTGDGLASDLAGGGPAANAFLADVLGLDFVMPDLRDFIGNQVAPVVLATQGSPVAGPEVWIAAGGCPDIAAFDGVTPRAGADRLAEFTAPGVYPGAYPYAAGTAHHLPYGFGPGGAAKTVIDNDNRIVSLPYDLVRVANYPASGGQPAGWARTTLLDAILDYLDPRPGGVETPAVGRLTLVNAPNPFNPTTRISYTIGRPGVLSVKLYDTRGALVRHLFDGRVESDGFVTWDGRDDRGGEVASGVYFTEARLDGEVRIRKVALVR